MLWADEVAWKVGDDPAWASPGFDDRGWRRSPYEDLAGQESLFWMRTRFSLGPSHAAGVEPLAIWFSGMATCDFYWDGVAVEFEGTPGADAEAEVPGPIDGRAYLATTLATEGEHLLAARCSTAHRQIEPTTGFYLLGVGPYVRLLEAVRGYSWKAMASLTAKLVAFVYFLVLFFLGRRRAALWLSLLSLAAAALLIAEAWRSLIGYSYDWHIPRLVVIHLLAWLCNAALLLYFLEQFPARRRWWVAGAALAASLAVPFAVRPFDGRVATTFLLGLVVCFLWGIGAIRRRAPAARLATGGVALALAVLAIDPMRFLDLRIFYVLDALLVLLLIARARESRRERDALEAERLRSTRLELELVKKSIQPHFLMNTLTALSEWFEREPAVAGEAIEALAREMRLLGDLAERRTVPLARELELCRAHLAVMSLRRGTRYELRVSGVDDDAPCPPGIVHTMVENAVTHGAATQGGRIEVELESRVEDGKLHYRLSSPLGSVTEPSRGEGTGLRYIRTRLEEAFGNAFDFSAQRQGEQWVNEWTVPAEEPG